MTTVIEPTTSTEPAGRHDDGGWPIGWQGKLIWASDRSGQPDRPVQPADMGLPPEAFRNRFCHLRREFQIDLVPSRALCRVTADSRFVLYLNGTEVARGPARALAARLAYEELDLAPHLRPGVNVLGAYVRFYGVPAPWWRPAPPIGPVSRGSFALECPAIGAFTDSSWRTAPGAHVADTRIPENQPLTEVIDGARVPRGWTDAGFDDSSWLPALELRSGPINVNDAHLPFEPYVSPEAAAIPLRSAIPVALTKIRTGTASPSTSEDPVEAWGSHDTASDPFTTFEVGGYTLATPAVRVRGERGAIVDVYVGEDLREDGVALIPKRFYGLRYHVAGEGEETIEGFEQVGFRYLTVVCRGNVELREVVVTERRYPFSRDASFECDDEWLNRIWQVGARTLELCSTDTFIDCPGREQRTWVGDSYVEALVNMIVSRDWRLIRRHLRVCAQDRRADGLLAMAAVADLGLMQVTIPEFSLHWLRALARYYEHSADEAFVRELLPAAADILAALERYRGADGLLHFVPGFVFIDWAQIDRGEVTTALDCLYAAGLDDYAALCEAMGDAHSARLARASADRTRSAVDAHLWDEERGVYIDCLSGTQRSRRVSQQANAAAIVAGCDPSRWSRIIEYITDSNRVVRTATDADGTDPDGNMRLWSDPASFTPFDAERNVVLAQPFFAHFLHQAVALAGRRDLLADLCVRWRPQLEEGNTTLLEHWVAMPGWASRCHAWSATATYDMTRHLLGVRPLAPGFARAEIKPYFGRLSRLSGNVPTPHGDLVVDVRRDGGRIVVPVGVTVQMAFEDAPIAPRELTAGTHELSS